jgi:subtilisin family serine protease
VSNRRDAEDAARDPRKLVARQMPVSVIRPLKARQFGMSAAGNPVAAAKSARAAWGIPAVLGPEPRALTGAGVRVCVLDTGIDASHAAFAGVSGKIRASRRNFTADGDDDADGHGTHCAGTIFGRNVDGVRIGVAPGVTDPLIGKVIGDDGSGSTKALIDALQWAHSEGANIVSMSLGFDFPRMQKKLQAQGLPAELATSITLKAYRDNLRQFETMAALLAQETEESAGVIIVAAAGNESRRHLDRDFVIDVSIPAAASRDVVSVGAVSMGKDGRFDVAPFSNINPVVCAPGVGVVSARAGGGLEALNGTSMACPHVAGIAALWWEFIRERNAGVVTAGDVRARLRGAVEDTRFLPSVSIADRGAGLVQAPQA